MVKVKVPASTANLGSGFDSLGMAVNLYNIFTFEEIDEGLEIYGTDKEFRNENNLVYTSFKYALKEMSYELTGVKITIESDIPLSGGLGSSAACIVGGVVAANEIAGRPYDQNKLLKLVTAIEGHPDNVAPALLGGLVVSIMDGNDVHYDKVNVAEGLKFVAIHPHYLLSTKEAREALPKTIAHSDGVFNVSRMGLLISALTNGRFDLLAYGFEDRLHQPYRSKLIPDYDEAVAICQKHGAFATFISGAGPTIMAAVDAYDSRFSEKVAKDLKSLSHEWDVLELEMDREGAQVI